MTSSERITKSSLWLIPPKDSALTKVIHNLINQTLPSSLFPEASLPNFAPHITLTADTVPADLSNPQEWLQQLSLSHISGLKIAIGELHVGDIFFQKMIQLCGKSEALRALAGTCRRAGTGEEEAEVEKWIEENYRPHLSLM